MKVYEHKQEFKIKYCDVDFKDEMKVSTALALMEEVAGDSADELGFGYTYIKPRGFAFVVSNLHLEFTSPIVLGEQVVVKTWPKVPGRVVFGREYIFEDNVGNPLILATSRWCLLDVKKGKILPSKYIDNQNYATYNTRELFADVKWRLPPFKAEEGELRFTLTVANSEYDHNMHVNNTRYADYCLNCFSVEELGRLRIKSFTLSFLKQCREGETLRFYRKVTEDGIYAVQGVNGGNEIVAQARIEVEEKNEKELDQ